MTGGRQHLMVIEAIDSLDEDGCRTALAPLFEGAPRFLARLCAARPFRDPSGLFATARAIARAMPEAEQVELLDAHPRLGAPRRSVSALSFVEQGYDRDATETAIGDLGATGAAPDREAAGAIDERACAESDLARLNAAYEARFGFRYCVFVAGRPLLALLPGFELALAGQRDAELVRSLDAVIDIAADRYGTVSMPGR